MQQQPGFRRLGKIIVPNNPYYMKLAEERMKEQYRKEHEEHERGFLEALRKFGKHNLVLTTEAAPPLNSDGKIYRYEGKILAWDIANDCFIGTMADPFWLDQFGETVYYRYSVKGNMSAGKHFLKSFKNNPLAKEAYENAQEGVYSMRYIRQRAGLTGILESCVKRLPFLVFTPKS